MPNARLALSASLALSLGATTARAQAVLPPTPASVQADSIPFRRGQWGVQFTGGPELTSVGALRFTSPRTAWLVLVDGMLIHQEQRSGGGAGSPVPGGDEVQITIGTVGARLGRRIYQPLDRRVVGFATAGVTGRYTRNDQRTTFGNLRSTAAGGGLFGDVGATYLVSEHFGLGASTGLEASYDRTVSSNVVGGARGSSVSVRLTQPLALLSVYF